jgi:hypothetical protein
MLSRDGGLKGEGAKIGGGQMANRSKDERKA